MRHRGQQFPYDPEKKVRTREHVISDLSYNFLERKVLQRGHWLDAPRNDYGIDATMFHHNERGEVENGEVRFQLKASDELKVSERGAWIALRIDTKDLRYWHFEFFPMIVVVYDADRDRAFWLHIQDHVRTTPRLLESDTDTVTLRIPTANKLNLYAIDQFRRLSLTCMAKIRNSFEEES